jgi:hypothetical protein
MRRNFLEGKRTRTSIMAQVIESFLYMLNASFFQLEFFQF